MKTAVETLALPLFLCALASLCALTFSLSPPKPLLLHASALPLSGAVSAAVREGGGSFRGGFLRPTAGFASFLRRLPSSQGRLLHLQREAPICSRTRRAAALFNSAAPSSGETASLKPSPRRVLEDATAAERPWSAESLSEGDDSRDLIMEACLRQQELLRQRLKGSASDEPPPESSMEDAVFYEKLKLSPKASDKEVAEAISALRDSLTPDSDLPAVHAKWMDLFHKRIKAVLEKAAAVREEGRGWKRRLATLLFGAKPADPWRNSPFPSELDPLEMKKLGASEAYLTILKEVQTSQKRRGGRLKRAFATAGVFIPLTLVPLGVKSAAFTAVSAAAAAAWKAFGWSDNNNPTDGTAAAGREEIRSRALWRKAAEMAVHGFVGASLFAGLWTWTRASAFLSWSQLLSSCLAAQWGVASSAKALFSEPSSTEGSETVAEKLQRILPPVKVKKFTNPECHPNIFDDEEFPTAFNEFAFEYGLPEASPMTE